MDLVSRAKGILLNPKGEWAAIDAESTTVGELYTGYIVPMAAIGAVCGLIGMTIIGSSLTGKTTIVAGFTTVIVGYVIALVTVYIMAMIVNALAPSFDGQKSLIQALKLIAYSSTALWVAGIFSILPALGGLLRLLGLIYSLYLLFTGIPFMMKTPAEKAGGYAAVVIIAWILLYIVLGTVIVGMMVATVGAGAVLPR
jgi:hypothetical protein